LEEWRTLEGVLHFSFQNGSIEWRQGATNPVEYGKIYKLAPKRGFVSSYRVLIVSDQPLFAQGVRTLIETRTHAQVIGIESYNANILDCARLLRPDIIIFGEGEDLPPTLPLALLDTSPNLRVIRLSLDDNVMHVYDGHRRAANSADDLADSIDTFAQASFATA
jgi:hypothetical protein